MIFIDWASPSRWKRHIGSISTLIMFAFGMRQVWFFVPQKISCSRDFTSALALYRLRTDGNRRCNAIEICKIYSFHKGWRC
jgi:hypothetical protein